MASWFDISIRAVQIDPADRGERTSAPRCGIGRLVERVIEVDGDAGPELAAEMDAPGVTVVCRGSTADGGAAG